MGICPHALLGVAAVAAIVTIVAQKDAPWPGVDRGCCRCGYGALRLTVPQEGTERVGPPAEAAWRRRSGELIVFVERRGRERREEGRAGAVRKRCRRCVSRPLEIGRGGRTAAAAAAARPPPRPRVDGGGPRLGPRRRWRRPPRRWRRPPCGPRLTTLERVTTLVPVLPTSRGTQPVKRGTGR